MLVKREKSGILAVTLTFVASSFVIYLHAHTLPDPQLSKVGKTEKSEPAVSRRKSPHQRGYEDVRSRSVPKGHWHRVPAKGDRAERRREAIAQGAVPEAIAGISLPLFGSSTEVKS